MTCSRTPGDFDVTVHVTQDLTVKPERTVPATMSGGWVNAMGFRCLAGSA
jgi:hypothetical protein